MPVVLAYADAQFNLTGSGFPLGPLHDFVDEDDGDEEEALVGDGLSILSRFGADRRNHSCVRP
jgi:hypothetical protein